MSYTTGKNIQRYQRMSPDIQTEWGTFTNPHILFHPDEYKYRQPAVPMLARGRSDVILPQPMGPQHLGYVGDYVPGPMGQAGGGSTGLLSGDTIKTILIIAGALLVLYLLFRDKKGVKENPCVSDFNALIDSGWVPPGGAPSPSRRTHTRKGRKSLSRRAKGRARIPKGQPGAGTFLPD
jgi:hypothetical protein